MSMTPTEERALALVKSGAFPMDVASTQIVIHGLLAMDKRAVALTEQIEATEARHAAEMQELKERFSEAVYAYGRLWQKRTPSRDEYDTHFATFIIPAHEPLVEAEDPIDALVDLLAPVLTHSQGMAARERENRFRNAIAALRAHQKDTNA